MNQNSRYMSKARLLRFYRMFRRSPMKIFIAKDFHDSTNHARQYLDTLVSLGLISTMSVYYNTGKRSRNKSIGYRLNRESKIIR